MAELMSGLVNELMDWVDFFEWLIIGDDDE